jgi:hypothetical protein
VAVDVPVTVSADDGVLASVTMVNESSRSVNLARTACTGRPPSRSATTGAIR